MSKTLELKLRHAQSEVFNSNKRFRVLVAGRRFGKSSLACIELFLKAVNRPRNVLLLRPDVPNGKRHCLENDQKDHPTAIYSRQK